MYLQEQLKDTLILMGLCFIEMAPRAMVRVFFYITVVTEINKGLLATCRHTQIHISIYKGSSVYASLLFSSPLSDSDSDSELSVDEHSSSYASSHSSDSEDDDIDVKPKWNNERQPIHSTPKGKCIVQVPIKC